MVPCGEAFLEVYGDDMRVGGSVEKMIEKRQREMLVPTRPLLLDVKTNQHQQWIMERPPRRWGAEMRTP